MEIPPRFKSIEQMALDRLEYGDAKPLRNWKVVKTYEALVAKGLAREVEEPNKFFRRFTLIKSEGCQLATYPNDPTAAQARRQDRPRGFR